jgi:hypothetical protein
MGAFARALKNSQLTGGETKGDLGAGTLEATGRIHDCYAGVRLLPEVRLFARHLISQNYGDRPETGSLFLNPVIVVRRHCVASAGG